MHPDRKKKMFPELKATQFHTPPPDAANNFEDALSKEKKQNQNGRSIFQVRIFYGVHFTIHYFIILMGQEYREGGEGGGKG